MSVHINQVRTIESISQTRKCARGRFKDLWRRRVASGVVAGVIAVAIAIAATGCGGSGGGKAPAKRVMPQICEIGPDWFRVLGGVSLGDSIDEAFKKATTLAESESSLKVYNEGNLFSLAACEVVELDEPRWNASEGEWETSVVMPHELIALSCSYNSRAITEIRIFDAALSQANRELFMEIQQKYDRGPQMKPYDADLLQYGEVACEFLKREYGFELRYVDNTYERLLPNGVFVERQEHRNGTSFVRWEDSDRKRQFDQALKSEIEAKRKAIPRVVDQRVGETRKKIEGLRSRNRYAERSLVTIAQRVKDAEKNSQRSYYSDEKKSGFLAEAEKKRQEWAELKAKINADSAQVAALAASLSEMEKKIIAEEETAIASLEKGGKAVISEYVSSITY